MQPWWCLKQLSTSKVVTLDKTKILVGRNAREKQFRLTSDKVSRSHSYFITDDEGNLYVQDVKSSNGTFVNGGKIECFIRHKLSPGDQIGFGLSKVKHAKTKADKETFFEVFRQPIQEESVANSAVESIPKRSDSLDKIVITNVCSLANEQRETTTRMSQRCLNRRSTVVNEQPITIESDDDSPQTKMVVENQELVKSTNRTEAVTAELTDNPIVIDITDEDDDIDFSCSQLFQMSQIVSERVTDETYQKIKNELAEMDYCTDGVVVNAEPIDLENENQGGFDNTQEIFELLEDKAEEPPDHPVVEALDDLVRIVDTEADNEEKSANRRRSSRHSTLKRKSSIQLPADNKRAKRSPVKGKDVKARKSRSPHVVKRNRSASPVPSQSLDQEVKEIKTPLKGLTNIPLRRSLRRECKNLQSSPTLKSSATLPDLNGCRPKGGADSKRKTGDAPLMEDSPPAITAMEPLRWQRYDNVGWNSANPSTSKCPSHLERAIPKGTDSYHLNAHPMGYNRQEASRLLMWGNGVPSRKPLNNRRLPKVDDIVREIVHWIPERLLQQLQNDVPAPIIKLPKKIPTWFTSFQQYYDTFSKMVLMESWQSLFKGFRDSNESPKKMKVQHVRVINDTLVLDCVSVISKEDVKRGNFYKPEDLVMLECAMRNKTHVLSMNFALVQSCRRSLVANNGVRHSINQLLNGPNPHTILEFTVLTRYQPELELNTKMAHFIKPLSTMRTYLMLIRAMKEMEHSALCKMILNPKVSDYKFPVTHREVRFRNNTWNEEQRTIVLEAASLCTGNRPGIYCVKGPPGTGKSTVIVSLLQQILFAEKRRTKDCGNPLILLTAPSNTAVDNLIFKISAARSSLPAELRPNIKLVRVGPESSIHKDLLNYSLPKLAEKHLPMKLQDHPRIKAAKEKKENLLEVAKTVLGNQYQNELRQCEKLIIEKSNIICTTLHSCINSRLIDAVSTGLVRFTCCVIDEATQCHEIESLLPLVLGIDKFVLVGDPQQLNATILSREASKLGFGESLFTRLSKSFGVDPRSPIRMLTEQYRMHPEICEFPSKRFYEGKLRTKANPTNKLPSTIRPYLVFNCEKLSPSDDYTNMDEVILIKKLLKTLCDMLDRNYSYTVGIITPYNAQKDLLSNHIGRNEFCQITINTVDSFQGSEKDIIIISCVRDSSNTFLQNPNRFNVALTRAKQALYIIGNYSLFKECPLLYDIREDAKRRKVLLDIKRNPRTIDSFRRYLLKAN